MGEFWKILQEHILFCTSSRRVNKMEHTNDNAIVMSKHCQCFPIFFKDLEMCNIADVFLASQETCQQFYTFQGPTSANIIRIR